MMRVCSSGGGYEEQRQAAMIQSAEFYAEEGRHLRWFYWIDSNGRLYTEDILPKNIATSLKSPKFLEFVAASARPAGRLRGRPGGRGRDKARAHLETRPLSRCLRPWAAGSAADLRRCDAPAPRSFFFRRLRPNDTGMHVNYPYVSPCGKEMNFVRCADRPVVFHTLSADGRLEWGASLREEFDPGSLSVCPHSGRMYHPCTSAARLGAEPGLLHAHVTARLAERLEEAPGGFLLSWDGRTVPVPFASGSAEQ